MRDSACLGFCFLTYPLEYEVGKLLSVALEIFYNEFVNLLSGVTKRFSNKLELLEVSNFLPESRNSFSEKVGKLLPKA